VEGAQGREAHGDAAWEQRRASAWRRN
jgi:hypothetical protein